MLHSATSQRSSHRPPPIPGWSPAALRWVLGGHRLAPGSAVLEVGCSDPHFVAAAAEMGIDTAVCLDPATAACSRWSDRAEARVWDASTTSSAWPARSFDLVLVRHHSSYELSLDHIAARQATAGWLALLKPSGALLVDITQLSGLDGHDRDCWAHHWSRFEVRPRSFTTDSWSVRVLQRWRRVGLGQHAHSNPRTSLTETRDGWFQEMAARDAFATDERSKSAAHLQLTGCRVPPHPIRPDEWMRQAERSDPNGPPCGCRSTRIPSLPQWPRAA